MVPDVAQNSVYVSLLIVALVLVIVAFFFLRTYTFTDLHSRSVLWSKNLYQLVMRRVQRRIHPLGVLSSSKQKMDASNAESLAAARASDGEITIVLHGVCANYYNAMYPLVRWLKRAGLNVVSLGFDYRSGHKAAAREVKQQIDTMLTGQGIRHINLVGLSFGGAVARYYVEILGGKHVVQKLITVCTPLKDPSHDNPLIAKILIRLFFRRDADIFPTDEERMDDLFSIPHVIIYGTSDALMGNLAIPKSVPSHVTLVPLSCGHAFVCFNSDVMEQIYHHVQNRKGFE
jgi:hypothetical protein